MGATDTVRTDALLFQTRLDTAPPSALASVFTDFCQARDWQAVRAAWSAGEGRLYLYAGLPQPAALAPAQALAHATALQAWLEPLCALPGLRGARLCQAFETPGASAHASPRFHYVVETDPATGWAEEIARWYDTEHMPGLAAVPGCVRARRFLNQDAGPRSLACYDLVTADTLGSPPWLAVRGTAWSSVCRPHFTNTLRTMFHVLPLAPAEAGGNAVDGNPDQITRKSFAP